MALGRRIRTVGLILGIGAVVNVCVAWACAAWHYAGQAQRTASQVSLEAGIIWNVASYSDTGVRRLHSIWGPIGTADGFEPPLRELAGEWAGELRPAGREDLYPGGARVIDVRGWPMHSMWSRVDFVLDAPRGRALAIESKRVRLGVALPDYSQWTPDEAELHQHRVMPLGILWWGFTVNTLLFGALAACLMAIPFYSRVALRVGAGRCGRCGYDLLHAARALCPECGSGFRPRWVGGRGARWIRRGVLTGWAGAAVTAVVIAGGLAWSGIDSAWLNTHKPVWWLALNGQSADADTAGAAVDELMQRLADGDLEDGQIDALVARALAIQADAGRPWVSEWGDLVADARDRALVDDGQWKTFVTQMIAPRLVARPRVVQGGPIACTIVVSVRGPSSGDFMLYAMHERTTLGDVSYADGRRVTARPLVSLNPAMMGMSLGPDIEMPSAGWLDAPLIADAAPGTHVLESAWRFKVAEGQPSAPFWSGSSSSLPGSATYELSAEIEVVPSGASTVELVHDESLRDAMRASIEVQLFRFPVGRRRAPFGADPSMHTMHGSLLIKDGPMDCAFEVFAWWRGEEWPIGTVTSEGVHYVPGRGRFGTFAGPLDFAGHAIDLILRPSATAAEETVGLTRIWDGTLTFRDVPVRAYGPRH